MVAVMVKKVRKGREFYSKNYGKVMQLHSSGVGTADIAKQVGLSYSAVYHWVRGLRKPDIGNVNAFESFLEQHGPQAAVEIAERFQKHNEIFHTSVSRGSQLRRQTLERKFGGYATWYFLPGQEEALKKRIAELLDKYKEMRGRIAQIMEGV